MFNIGGGKMVTAHRFSMQCVVGPLTSDQHVLHKCDNKICVNPKHLYVGTPRDNSEDRLSRGRLRRGEGGRFTWP